MLSRTFCAVNVGLKIIKIEVEVSCSQGTPNLIIIGLPTKAVEESKERITAALINCGIRIRSKRTIVNLAPADIKKSSAVFELAIAIGMLTQYQEITINTDDTIFFGELSLDGELKAIKGALPLVMTAKKMGFKKVILPTANQDEVSIITGINIYPISHLNQYLSYAKNEKPLIKLKTKLFNQNNLSFTKLDFADIHGQEYTKRSLEIAAAGGHNLLMIGPPGAGKSQLAKTIISILPPLTQKETLEITTIYSICGLIKKGIISNRPFRSPHHSASLIGLIGGGNNLSPGEVSLSHKGILFLDEITEFKHSLLEALRQPLEDRMITITRAAGTLTYPASFTLIAASNPCQCGWYRSQQKKCCCAKYDIQRYNKKLSGPILDRIDLFIRVKPTNLSNLTLNTIQNKTSPAIRNRVCLARELQLLFLKKIPPTINSELTTKQVNELVTLKPKAQNLLTLAINKYHLTARSYFRIIKTALTIANLDQQTQIFPDHLAEALQYRNEVLF